MGGSGDPAARTAGERAVANRRFWFAHEFRRYPALSPDLDALPVAELPGGHSGYVAQPEAFADAPAEHL